MNKRKEQCVPILTKAYGTKKKNRMVKLERMKMAIPTKMHTAKSENTTQSITKKSKKKISHRFALCL
jgi:hypothetical protein